MFLQLIDSVVYRSLLVSKMRAQSQTHIAERLRTYLDKDEARQQQESQDSDECTRSLRYPCQTHLAERFCKTHLYRSSIMPTSNEEIHLNEPAPFTRVSVVKFWFNLLRTHQNCCLEITIAATASSRHHCGCSELLVAHCSALVCIIAHLSKVSILGAHLGHWRCIVVGSLEGGVSGGRVHRLLFVDSSSVGLLLL